MTQQPLPNPADLISRMRATAPSSPSVLSAQWLASRLLFPIVLATGLTLAGCSVPPPAPADGGGSTPSSATQGLLPLPSFTSCGSYAHPVLPAKWEARHALVWDADARVMRRGKRKTPHRVAQHTEDLGLKEAGIQLTDRGFIKINERMETSVKGIYAMGDVAGPPMLAHKGSREGVVFAEFLAGQKQVHPVNYGNIPNATYCHPEVASIGMTEAQVKEKKIDYKVGKFLFSNNGRARTSGETDGFVKIIRDAKYGEILGAHIIGAHATELIHELAVARENEFTVEEVDLAIHAHPTLSEAIAEATLDSLGKMIHA